MAFPLAHALPRLLFLAPVHSGEVVALGPDCGGTLHVGQAVAVTTCSSFSEYCVAKAAMCTPLEGRWVGHWSPVDV